MSNALDPLLALPGVTGLLFHRGQEIVDARLPQTYGAGSTRLLCRAVINGFSGYATSGRQATQCWFEFPEASVLSLTPPLRENQITRSIARPEAPQQIAAPFLTFILSDRTGLDQLLPPANAFLARQAAIQMDVWLRCRDELLRIASRKSDLPTAKRHLLAELEACDLSPDASVASADFHLLAENYFRRTSRPEDQAAQLAELTQALAKLDEKAPAIRTRAV